MAYSSWVLANSVDERGGVSDQELHILIVQLHQRADSEYNTTDSSLANVLHMLHKTYL